MLGLYVFAADGQQLGQRWHKRPSSCESRSRNSQRRSRSAAIRPASHPSSTKYARSRNERARALDRSRCPTRSRGRASSRQRAPRSTNPLRSPAAGAPSPAGGSPHSLAGSGLGEDRVGAHAPPADRCLPVDRAPLPVLQPPGSPSRCGSMRCPQFSPPLELSQQPVIPPSFERGRGRVLGTRSSGTSYTCHVPSRRTRFGCSSNVWPWPRPTMTLATAEIEGQLWL